MLTHPLSIFCGWEVLAWYEFVLKSGKDCHVSQTYVLINFMYTKTKRRHLKKIRVFAAGVYQS